QDGLGTPSQVSHWMYGHLIPTKQQEAASLMDQLLTLYIVDCDSHLKHKGNYLHASNNFSAFNNK
ncbi:unnamed protein product, partial [marine sediment metagenome]